MRTEFISILCLSFLISSANGAEKSEFAGIVKTEKGEAYIVRQGLAIPAKEGLRFNQYDILKTGQNASLGVIFRDDTVLSLGPDSEIRVKDFAFSPAEGKLAIVTKMIKGSAMYLSGQITKLSPESARFETPVATIGIRGTRFLVKIEPDGQTEHDQPDTESN